MSDFMSPDNLMSLFVGLMVSIAIIIAFERVGASSGTSTLKRARSVFALMAGLFVYYFLRENPNLAGQYTQEIALALIGILLALLIFLRRQFER